MFVALMGSNSCWQKKKGIVKERVADYTPSKVSEHKIKKSGDDFTINFERTKDIAFEIGKIKKDKFLVIFAAESQNAVENAKSKIERKNADLIVLNDITKKGAGFGCDTNIVTMIDKELNLKSYPIMKKRDLAKQILKVIDEKISTSNLKEIENTMN